MLKLLPGVFREDDVRPLGAHIGSGAGVRSFDSAPPHIFIGTVTIVTTSGARFTSTVDAPRGSGPRGIEWSDVEAKYRALMPESKLPAKRLDDILDRIHGFDRVKNVSELTRLLVPGR